MLKFKSSTVPTNAGCGEIKVGDYVVVVIDGDAVASDDWFNFRAGTVGQVEDIYREDGDLAVRQKTLRQTVINSALMLFSEAATRYQVKDAEFEIIESYDDNQPAARICYHGRDGYALRYKRDIVFNIT